MENLCNKSHTGIQYEQIGDPPQTILSEDHISFYTPVRGLDILPNVIVLGYVTFYQINKCFVKRLLFFHY